MPSHAPCLILMAAIWAVALAAIATATKVEAADPTPAQKAVAMMKHGEGGVLATVNNLSPYISSTPFVIDAEGRPIIYISDLARHTRYIKANPNASIIVNKPDKDGSYFNGSRCTIGGKAFVLTDEKEIADAKKRYFSKYKEAEGYAELHDFNFYRLDCEDIFFIGGFGDINVIKVSDYKDAAKE